MRRFLAPAMLAQALALSACESGDQGTFQGVFFWGFETSSFRACGTTEFWWASGEIQPLIDVQPAPGAPGVYAVVEGEVSLPGSYGHLGAYPRQIEIRQVQRVEPAPPGSCP